MTICHAGARMLGLGFKALVLAIVVGAGAQNIKDSITVAHVVLGNERGLNSGLAQDQFQYMSMLATEQKRCPSSNLTCPDSTSTKPGAAIRLVRSTGGKCSEWGYARIDMGGTWRRGAWSRLIGVGFTGKAENSEQYQTHPPGCEQECKRRPATESAAAAHAAATCPAGKSLPNVELSAGSDHTCASTQGQKAICWGSDRNQKSSRIPRRKQVSQISAGSRHSCAILKSGHDGQCPKKCLGGVVKCSGYNGRGATQDHYRKLPYTTKMIDVAACGLFTCGIMADSTSNGRGAFKRGQIRCWGFDGYKIMGANYGGGGRNTGMADEVKGSDFRALAKCALTSAVMCAIKTSGHALCWGTGDTTGIVAGTPKGVVFKSLSVGKSHACGITESDNLMCWGSDDRKQCTGWSIPQDKCTKESKMVAAPRFGWMHVACSGLSITTKWLSVDVGEKTTCGILKGSGAVKCWGCHNGNWRNCHDASSDDVAISTTNKWASNITVGVFTSVAVGAAHACAVKKDSQKVVCWGENSKNQLSVPAKRVKWTENPACLTSHPDVEGPTSCTSCDAETCNKHFTITSPKTNTGTCTRLECPFCKPKSCCGHNHKHYVLNTANFQGVCVAHDDDCTPVCVPSEDTMTKRRVCTKGCNQLVKAVRNVTAKTEVERFKIVVCQADKRVVCEPESRASRQPCTVRANFIARAVCNFSIQLWNLGATCLATHVNNAKYKRCKRQPASWMLGQMRKHCVPANQQEDNKACSRLGMTF